MQLQPWYKTKQKREVLFPTTQVSRNVEQQHLGHPTTPNLTSNFFENLWSRHAVSCFCLSCKKKKRKEKKIGPFLDL